MSRRIFKSASRLTGSSSTMSVCNPVAVGALLGTNCIMESPGRFLPIGYVDDGPRSNQISNFRGGLVKIYTKQGDQGFSGLFDGQRVPKNNVRLECFGTVDEMNSH